MKKKKSNSESALSVAFTSLGCFKNTVDTEVLAGMLCRQGLQPVSGYETCDWMVLNTCGFLGAAKEEGLEHILDLLEKKERGEIRFLAVFGCLVQRYGQELARMFPQVDLFWGVNDLEKLALAIASGKKKAYSNRGLFLYSDKNERVLTTTPNSTFIKISEGCNMRCSFCAIPSIRGHYRSRELSSVLREAEGYRSRGFLEVNIVSQNSTYFGAEADGKSRLPELLREISRLGFSWVRVLYLMPEMVDQNLLEAFAQPSILPYFDLPFQHVVPSILRRMNRGGGYRHNLNLLRAIRGLFPEAVIRSTFLVGFPGESEGDFARLRDFAAESTIEHFGVFAYSAEEGTESFSLAPAVPDAIIEERKNLLLEISDRNLAAFQRRIVRTRKEFLPLGPWQNQSTIGRIWTQAPEVDGFTVVPKRFHESYRPYAVRIMRYDRGMLYGELP